MLATHLHIIIHQCVAAAGVSSLPSAIYLFEMIFVRSYIAAATVSSRAVDVLSTRLQLLTGYILIMTDTLEYLLTFRKCSSLDSLEKVYDKLNYSIDNDTEMSNMYRAADHRRAELVAGKLFDLGKVPKTLWAQVL